MKERTYWNEEFKGEGKGGFFVRFNLHEQIKNFEEKGFNVIGIKVEDSWNVEFICEDTSQTKSSAKEKKQ